MSKPISQLEQGQELNLHTGNQWRMLVTSDLPSSCYKYENDANDRDYASERSARSCGEVRTTTTNTTTGLRRQLGIRKRRESPMICPLPTTTNMPPPQPYHNSVPTPSRPSYSLEQRSSSLNWRTYLSHTVTPPQSTTKSPTSIPVSPLHNEIQSTPSSSDCQLSNDSSPSSSSTESSFTDSSSQLSFLGLKSAFEPWDDDDDDEEEEGGRKSRLRSFSLSSALGMFEKVTTDEERGKEGAGRGGGFRRRIRRRFGSLSCA